MGQVIETGRRRRRLHSAQFKADAVGACQQSGVSVAAVYHPVNGQLAEVAGSGGVSPVEAPHSVREKEAELADGWFHTITAEVFG